MLRLLNRLLNAAIGVAVFLMGAALLNKYSGNHPWVPGVVLCFAGVVLYLGNAFLIRSYITKRAPEFADDENWEITAGTGIVPRWVSFLGLLCIPAFIAAAYGLLSGIGRID